MYFPQLFNSFVRRLLGNGKWYKLRLRSRWHYQFLKECNNFHKGIFKTKETVYERENLGLSEEQGIWSATVVFLEIGLIIMQLRPKNVILWNRRNKFKHDFAQVACLWMKYFLSTDFIVTFIHWVTYKYVSYFSKSEHIWSFWANCYKSQKDVLVKPLPVQKSICLLIQLFNHPENQGNTSKHPSLSNTIALIIFIDSITLIIMTKVSVSVFHFLSARTETLVWRHQEWLHTAWRHVAAFTLCVDCVNKTVL